MIAGLTLPQLSAFDPPAAGEGSIDPMGLAAISDRLAERLVPALRARMQRVRFVTATAVGAMACETLGNVPSADDVSTPAIAFEWHVVEAFVRRLPPSQVPAGVPGSMKARTVVGRQQRLSAATYLKGPSVFGFNGVYKPFAVDADVVDNDLLPGAACADLTHAWEIDQGHNGFTDATPGSGGSQFRAHITSHVRDGLRAGRCTTKPNNWLFGYLAESLHPDRAGVNERAALRRLISSDHRETRAELAHLLDDAPPGSEAELLAAIRPRCSVGLAAIVDAVVAYERFALRVDAAFRVLCSVSHAQGAQPLTPQSVQSHETIVRCAKELPDLYRIACDRMSEIGAVAGFEERLGEFALTRSSKELVELVMAHHHRIQSEKPPNGKRAWFEPLRNGWVVRPTYGSNYQPLLDGDFVHPIRVAALRRFLDDTRP